MFVKRQTVPKKNGRVYQYVYLAESYRDAKGRPRHRHIASLTGMPDTLIDNVECALNAARLGEAVVIESREFEQVQIGDNLRYLDAAVMLDVWRDWGLDEICRDLLPHTEHAVPPADVVAALTLQRCLEPDSKLAAVDWFRSTALPELLSIAPSSFNNTRIHRVLDDLCTVEAPLQHRMAQRAADRCDGFATLFLDSTDTFFVGRGTELARMGKTKEGRMELKIGIVLLCNELGEPLRWDVVEGTSADNRLFRDVFESLVGLEWVRNVPIVVDRAMGHTADIEAMAATGLQFVTALTANELDAYAPEIPRAEVGALSLHLSDDPTCAEADCRTLETTVRAADFEQVDRALYTRDLGVREVRSAVPPPRGDSDRENSPRAALLQGHEIRRRLDAGEFRSQARAADGYERSKAWVEQRLVLTRLSESIQGDILAENAEYVAITRLVAIGRRPLEDQMREYLDLKATSRGPKPEPRPPLNSADAALHVRHVLYFNPELHLQKRRSLLARMEQAQIWVEELNQNIVDGRKRSSTERICADVEAKLAQLTLANVFNVETGPDGTIELAENTEYLTHLRGRFGFCLLVAHADVLDTPEGLVRAYRAKNTVERDFKTIKSCVELRPIRHRTTPKVRAHVTLCMLALALVRSLEARLAKLGITAERAMAELQRCQLNDLGAGLYTMTTPHPEQLKVLKQLDLTHLADDDEIARRITPRTRL